MGDSVSADECIAKVETDKTTMDIMAPEAGVIEAFLVDDGSTIGPNQPVIKITTGGGASSAPKAPAPKAAEPAPKAPEPVTSASMPTPVSMPAVPSIRDKGVPVRHVFVAVFN